MWSQILVLLGTLAGAGLAYVFQSLTAARQRRYQVADRTRAERLQAAAALPTALVEYRHAQIARRRDLLKTGAGNPTLDDEVRAVRAQAWSALYRFELLIDDQALRAAAVQAMQHIRELKTIGDLRRLDEAGTEIHWDIQEFVKLARNDLA